jgi:hypothetical protein
MKLDKVLVISSLLLVSNISIAGSTYVGGKITSLLASATDPAIRLTGNVSPELCDGGTYGWLYFEGTAEERNRVYSTALALSLTGKNVTIYVNGDGARCRINNIQVTIGLN